jgi:hypothetical protein
MQQVMRSLIAWAAIAVVSSLTSSPARAQGALTGAIGAARVEAAAADADSTLPAGARVIRVGDREYVYTKPRRFEMVRNLPSDFGRFGGSAFSRERIPAWIALGAGTAALIAVDQPVVDEMQRFGDRIHLSKNHDMVDLFEVPIPFAGKSFPVRGPSTFSSLLYFMGDGWSSVLTAGGLVTAGAITHDSRALRTASEVVESFLATGITAQVLKRSFGRETPSERARAGSHAGGRWRPFPSFSEYGDNVPGYDAFPSGHLSTVMSTVTVVALNYPEKRWIRPVGYSAMTVLAYQMMNNGVHWASDYPIAIAFGDLFAHIVVARGRTERPASADAAPGSSRLGVSAPRIVPLFEAGRTGVALRVDF